MGLNEYHRKRDFDATQEPRGEVHDSGPLLSFVIQKHAASHLHFDFRLELDGVLKSWAVPKGPSLDPSVKRLAVHVEDHPIEYGTFEGIIPRKEYGGGTVMLWDRGTWTPLDDAHKGYRKGHLRFSLQGERLRGAWHLVRSRRGEEGEKEQWLLFKSEDEASRPEAEGIITEQETTSIDTGRTMDEIAADADAQWSSRAPAAEAMTRSKPAPRKPAAKSASRPKAAKAGDAAARPGDAGARAEIPGSRKAGFPAAITPQLATLVDDVPAGEDWLHEIKYDGYRLLCLKRGGEVRLVTRKGNDWTDRFPTVVAAARRLPAETAVLDGEVVVLTAHGTTSFQALQNVMGSGRASDLVFYAFDLLYLDGRDLRGAALLARKEALRGLMAGSDAAGALRFSDHILGRGEDFFAQACRMGLEGIISKQAYARHQAKRTREWVKVKCIQRQEFVIGGFTDPKGSRGHFGALLVGVHDEHGKLAYSGKVGTGFNAEGLRELYGRMAPLEQADSPFSDYGRRGRRPAGVHWVEPKLVAELAFTEWTDEGILRHPVFQGLREDKPAREVVRERAKHLSDAEERPKAAAKPATARSTPSPTARPVPPSTAQARPRGKAGPVEVAGIRLTSPDKLLFPGVGITKLDLARYYERIAGWILPHLEDRPLTLVRCPDGVGGPCFYQKHGGSDFDKAVGKVMIRETAGDERDYAYVDSLAGIIALVQMSVLELHTSNAHRQTYEKPDRFVMDMDPAPDVPWERVVESAFHVRDRLDELGLRSWCKTTGGKGLHVVVPLARRHTWDEVKDFTRALAADVSGRYPGRYLTKATIAKRQGKTFIDYLRNGRGATAIAAYCIRARPSAAVSVPIAWDELTPALRTDTLTPDAVIARLESLEADPWKDFHTTRQVITKVMRAELRMR
ncbi:MAG TPA: DNA ligase D [Longimicrobium sp.]|nr:DNA ligase D [Longimicrobium sp.]